jgi:tetratricopeptide (TPR) repeat protein
MDDETVVQRLSEALVLFRQVNDDYYTASVQRVLGFIDYRKGNFRPAQQKLMEALALFRKLDNQEGIAVTLTNLGYVAAQQFNYAVARPLFEESLALRRRTGNQYGVANCLDALGAMHIHQKNYQAAKLVLTESWNIYQAVGNRQAEGTPLHLLGAVAYIEGDYAKARATFEQAYARATRSKNNEWLAELHLVLAVTAFRLGHQRKAASLLSDALQYYGQTSLFEKIIVGLMIASLLALATEETRYGLRLAAKALQCAEAARPHILFSPIQDELQHTVTEQLEQTGRNGTNAWAEGEVMSLDEAVDGALDLLTRQ